jgi:hypothetical protein
MCKVCDSYRQGKIDAGTALRQLSDGLKSTKGEGNKLRLEKHMFALSEEILNNEVPMAERNEQADKDFWNSTHPEDGDDG